MAGLAALVAGLVPGPAAAAAEAATAPQVLDVQRFATQGGTAADALREISGLEWNPAPARLVAVSDRGRVIEFRLDLDRAAQQGRLNAEPLSIRRIELEPRVNAESVALEGSVLWLADEARRQLVGVTRDGTAVALRPWPGALAEPGALRGESSGVEALVHHPRHGLLALLQRPRPTDDPGLHVVHGDKRSWPLAAAPGVRSSIKAAHLHGERLRLIEKHRPEGGSSADDRFWLAEADLAACAPATPCAVRRWPLLDARLAGHNLEGLACLDRRLCILASDSGPKERGADTLLVLLAWPER